MADRARFVIVAGVIAAALVTANPLGGTYAAFSDYDIFNLQAGAGTWGPDLSIPAECAQIVFDGEPIVGSDAGEAITGTNGNDLIFALGGDDVVQGGNGDDCIVGGDGNDVLGGDRQFENGQDVILGGPGNDAIDGGNAKDLLYGGPGDDLLNGSNGDDRVHGEAGVDYLVGGNGTELLDGGGSGLEPDDETDRCEGGRAPEVYVGCEVIDGADVTALEATSLAEDVVDDGGDACAGVPVPAEDDGTAAGAGELLCTSTTSTTAITLDDTTSTTEAPDADLAASSEDVEP